MTTVNEAVPEQEQPPGEGAARPMVWAHWILAGVLFTAYLPLQILYALPLFLYVFNAGLLSPEELMTLSINNPVALAITLAATAMAAVVTIALAAAWPRLWRAAGQAAPRRDWLAWHPPERLPLWAVPLVTVPVLFVVGIGVVALFGEPNIQIQLDIFSRPELKFPAAVIVSTIVPVAEELVFRGGLYTALLATVKQQEGWQRHILPFSVTMVLFALVHLLADFTSAAAIVQIFLLSAYLTGLRAVTGSVQSSVAAHMVWNLIAAVGLILSDLVV